MRAFRETLWFKKGKQDEQKSEPDGDQERDVDDRYDDDGSITPVDTAQWSLHTGTTQPIPPTWGVAFAEGTGVAIQALVGEMKHSSRKVVTMVAVSVVAMVAVVGAFIA